MFGSETFIERDGSRVLQTLEDRCPERAVGAGNDTNIRDATVPA